MHGGMGAWQDSEMERLVLAGLTFIVSLLALWGVSVLGWRMLGQWAQSQTRKTLRLSLVRQLKAPLRVMGLFLAIALALTIGFRHHPSAAGWTQLISKLIVVFCAAWFLERLATVFITLKTPQQASSVATRNLLLVLVRILIGALAILDVLDTVGVSITPILASLGIGSLAVALALQDTLGNFFSGLYILLDQPIRVGDMVRVEPNTEGCVLKVGWRSTQIQIASGNVVVIPNSKVATSYLTNYNLPQAESSFLVELVVAFGSDLDAVEILCQKVGRDILGRIEGGVSHFEPQVRFHTVADIGIRFSVQLRGRSFADTSLLRHEFLKNILIEFRRARIPIPSTPKTITMVDA